MKYLIVLLFVLGCSQPKDTALKVPATGEDKIAEKLIAIDVTDTVYGDARTFAKDIITADGWKIEYLVKDDSTRYTDVYIRWKKGDIKRIYKSDQALQMRSYFIPSFAEESKTHLFFEHGCATGCLAILALPKNSTNRPTKFDAVIDYNAKMGLIVNRINYGDDPLIVGVTNLNRNKTKLVKFKRICSSLVGTCIDTIVFSNKNITVKGGFINKHGRLISETKIVKL